MKPHGLKLPSNESEMLLLAATVPVRGFPLGNPMRLRDTRYALRVTLARVPTDKRIGVPEYQRARPSARPHLHVYTPAGARARETEFRNQQVVELESE